MSRTIIKIEAKSTIDPQVALEKWRCVIEGAGYKEKIIKGEPCWSKGDGVLMQQQNFAIVFGEREIILQAWMGDAIVGEHDLTGWLGKLPKSQMKKLLDQASMSIQETL